MQKDPLLKQEKMSPHEFAELQRRQMRDDFGAYTSYGEKNKGKNKKSTAASNGKQNSGGENKANVSAKKKKKGGFMRLF